MRASFNAARFSPFISLALGQAPAYIGAGGLRFPAGETYPRGLIDP